MFRNAAKRLTPVAAGLGAAAGVGAGVGLCSAPSRAESDSGKWAWSTGCSSGPSLDVSLKHVPEADPDFMPAVLWNRAYRKLAAETSGSAPLAIGLSRPGAPAPPFSPAPLWALCRWALCPGLG